MLNALLQVGYVVAHHFVDVTDAVRLTVVVLTEHYVIQLANPPKFFATFLLDRLAQHTDALGSAIPTEWGQ